MITHENTKLDLKAEKAWFVKISYVYLLKIKPGPECVYLKL